jgi:hypothetical protein
VQRNQNLFHLSQVPLRVAARQVALLQPVVALLEEAQIELEERQLEVQVVQQLVVQLLQPQEVQQQLQVVLLRLVQLLEVQVVQLRIAQLPVVQQQVAPLHMAQLEVVRQQAAPLHMVQLQVAPLQVVQLPVLVALWHTVAVLSHKAELPPQEAQLLAALQNKVAAQLEAAEGLLLEVVVQLLVLAALEVPVLVVLQQLELDCPLH